MKRSIKKLIDKARKHINILECQQRGEIRRKEKYEKLERKYNIKKNQMLKRVNNFGVTYGIMRKNMKEMQNG